MTDKATQAVELIKVLNRLIEVLQQEIHMLKQMDPAAMQSLQHDKIVLTAAYESMLKSLQESPDGLGGLPDDLRRQVMQVSTAFQNAMTDNARALFAVKEANDRLFQAIVQAIEEKRGEGQAYSASGTVPRRTAGHSAQALTVAIDQRL